MSNNLDVKEQEENKRHDDEDEEEEEDHDDNAIVIPTTEAAADEHQIVVHRSRSAAFRLRKAGLHLRFLLGPLARKRSQVQAPEAMPTGMFCGLRPFLTGRKLFRAEAGGGQSRKKHQVITGPKQLMGWARGGSVTSMFVLMKDLREKIILFRNVFNLPPCDVSASMNEIVTEAMGDLHNLDPEIMPIKDLSDLKQGISIHEVLIYLCGALRSVGDSWVTTDHEWMDEATLYRQNNMDELNSEQLVELALATVNCLIKIPKENHEVTDEEDEEERSREDILPDEEKVVVETCSETNTPLSVVASPVRTPTSVLPEMDCSSPRAKEFSNLYCSSPFLRFLSLQPVGKLNRIDIKRFSSHLFPHGSSHGHHKNNASGDKMAETESKSNPYRCQPYEELIPEGQMDKSSDNHETRESEMVDRTTPTIMEVQEFPMPSQPISEASAVKENVDTTTASVPPPPPPPPPQPPPSTIRIHMKRGSRPPKPPPLFSLRLWARTKRSEVPQPPPPPACPTRRPFVSQPPTPPPPQPQSPPPPTKSTTLELTPQTTVQKETTSSSSPLSLNLEETRQEVPPPPPVLKSRADTKSTTLELTPHTTVQKETTSSSSPLSLNIQDTRQEVPPSLPPPPSQIEKPTLPRSVSLHVPRTMIETPPPPPLPRASSNGSTLSKTQPSTNGHAPPPPPPGATKQLRPRRAQTKLKRSSQMGNLYRVLKGKVEGGNQVRTQNGRGSSNSNNGGGKQGMADALAEITKRSAYFRQIQEDVETYAKQITKLKSEITSFKTKDMGELVNFYNYVESVLENLIDESQVLARFEGFPQKKLEAIRSAAALYNKLKGIATELQTWKIESPLDRLLDRIERYFQKMNGELDAFERTKEEECKKFKSHNIDFNLQILVQIKEAVVDLSSNCMELALKERREAESGGAQPSKACCKTLWRAFQFAFRVYTFAGGHDDRADRLTRELAQQIEEDYRRMQEDHP